MAKVYASGNENVSDLFPADNIRENAESHHAKHHGNEIDCLGVKAYCGGRYWSYCHGQVFHTTGNLDQSHLN